MCNSAVFVGVPQGIRFRVKVRSMPEGYKATVKNAQKNKSDDIDSDIDKWGTSDRYEIPRKCGEFFDTIDISFVSTA